MARAGSLRLLTTFFVRRFFDAEVFGPSVDGRLLLLALIPLLAAPGVAIPIFMAAGGHETTDPSTWGWSTVARELDPAALRDISLSVKAQYVTYAMGLAALFSALCWRRLVPDRRDAMLLGATPASASTVLLARVLALAIVTCLFAFGVHALSALAFGAALASGGGLVFFARGVLAHLVATGAASLFAVLVVVGSTGVLLAIVGARRFDSALGALQAAVAAATLSLLMALPAFDSAAAVQQLAATPGVATLVPPMWFLGLYEWMLGSPAEGLSGLALVGLQALAALSALVAASYPWSYQRLRAFALAGAADQKRRARWHTRPIHRVIDAATRRTPVPAVARFHLAALSRGPAQRLIVSLAAGATLAVALPAWLDAGGGGAVPDSFAGFAWPMWSILFLVAALRFASAVPIDTGGDWLFDLRSPWPAAVRRTVVLTLTTIGVVPAVLASFIVFWIWWGLGIATANAVVVGACGLALVELLVGRSAAVPCAAPLTLDGPMLKRRAAIGVALLVPFAFVVPSMMFVASPFPVGLLIVTGFWTAVAAAVVSLARRRPLLDAGHEATSVIGRALRANGRFRASTSATIEPGADLAPVPSRSSTFALGSGRRVRGPNRAADRWFEDMDFDLRGVARDVSQAARQLRRAPGFAFFGVVILAVGIGATVATRQVLSELIGQASHIDDPDSLFVIRSRNFGSLSPADFDDLRRRQTSFRHIGAWSDFPTSLAWDNGAALVEGQLVSGDFFAAVGTRPAAGRLIQAQDDDPASLPVVVLAHQFWRSSLQGRPDIVGSAVFVGGIRHDVVGVAPPEFVGIQVGVRRPDVFVPLAHPPPTDAALEAFRQRPDSRWLRVVGRLRPDATGSSARAELTAIGASLDADRPLPPIQRGSRRLTDRNLGMTSAAYDSSWERAQSTGRTFLLVPLVVLLATVLNLATLVLTRETSRRGELAVRQALGASRWSLIRTTAAELTMLAVAGAGAALVSASVVIRFAATFVEESIAYRPEIGLEGGLGATTVITAGVLVVVAVAAAGLIPAVRATGKLSDALGRDASRSTSRGWAGRQILIAGQVAITVCLLLMAAVSVRTALMMAPRYAELDLQDLVVATVPFRLQGQTGPELHRTIERVLTAGRASTTLAGTAAVTSLPVEGSSAGGVTVTPQGQIVPDELVQTADFIGATPLAFGMLDLAPTQGRLLTDADLDAAARVAVISEGLGRALFGGADSTGRTIDVGLATDTIGAIGPRTTEPFTVVGTVTDVIRADGHPLAMIYAPLSAIPSPDVTFIAAARDGQQAAALEALRSTIRSVDPTLPFTFSGRGEQLVRVPALLLRFLAKAAGALALVALALSMTGLYAVLSHLVVLRRQELGIRLALGGSPAAIVKLIMSDGARPVLIGIGVGVAFGAVARLSLQPLVSDAIDAIDPLVTLMAAVPLVIAALIACYLPARRAARTDPLGVIRS